MDDLATHQLVHFVNTLGARSAGFEYSDGTQEKRLSMRGAITVNNADAYTAACLAELGIIQVPCAGVRDLIAAGRLGEVLHGSVPMAMPLSLLYANRRNLARRVRVVMDWLAEVLGAYLANSQPPPADSQPVNA